MPVARGEPLADKLKELLFGGAACLEGDAFEVALEREGGDLEVSSPDLAQELHEGDVDDGGVAAAQRLDRAVPHETIRITSRLQKREGRGLRVDVAEEERCARAEVISVKSRQEENFTLEVGEERSADAQTQGATSASSELVLSVAASLC